MLRVTSSPYRGKGMGMEYLLDIDVSGITHRTTNVLFHLHKQFSWCLALSIRMPFVQNALF